MPKIKAGSGTGAARGQDSDKYNDRGQDHSDRGWLFSRTLAQNSCPIPAGDLQQTGSVVRGKQNRETREVRGGDTGGYWRDDKGRKDGGRDPHGGNSRGTGESPNLKRNIDINKADNECSRRKRGVPPDGAGGAGIPRRAQQIAVRRHRGPASPCPTSAARW
jgi:hypothetical protein